MSKKWLIAGIGGALIVFGGALVLKSFRSPAKAAGASSVREAAANEAAKAVPDRVESVTIEPNATFSAVMGSADVSATDTAAIYAASKDVYDLANIRAGKTLDLHHDAMTDVFKEKSTPSAPRRNCT